MWVEMNSFEDISFATTGQLKAGHSVRDIIAAEHAGFINTASATARGFPPNLRCRLLCAETQLDLSQRSTTCASFRSAGTGIWLQLVEYAIADDIHVAVPYQVENTRMRDFDAASGRVRRRI